MKPWLVIFPVGIFLIVVGFFLFRPEKLTNQIQRSPMKLDSPVFIPGNSIPVKYSCKGEGINPPLVFSDVPKTAQSLVLVVSDPDAPMGTFIHWLVWNISPTTKEIAENSTPQNSIEGTNTAGTNKYIGPCPPSGSHRYEFHLYALDTVLTLPSEAKIKDLESIISGHIVGETSLIGVFP